MTSDAPEPSRVDWREPASVGVGAAVGAGARWVIGSALDVAATPAGAFPWHTMTVNLLGCLMIGILAVRATTMIAHAFVITGLLGGFTTTSAFAMEIYDLSESGRGDLAALYVVASVLGGVAAVWLSSAWAVRAATGGRKQLG